MASPVQILQQTDFPATHQPVASFTDSRGARRFPLATPVRAGWICDDCRMTYAEAEGIDISENGISIRMQERLRLSALVHLDLTACRLTAMGRVTSCVGSGTSFRIGLDLVDAFHAAPDAH